MEDDKRKREGAQLLLRFNEGSDMRENLKRVAALNGRTLTAEILYRLEKSLEEDETSAPAASSDVTLEQRLATLEAKFDDLATAHLCLAEEVGKRLGE